ncbi:MAG: hypothetical protein ACLFR1_05790 [Spirochaetia bacterium]
MALVVGLLFIGFAVFSVLPAGVGLGWWPLVSNFLVGGIPVIAVFVGLIALFIGIADIKDRMDAKKEEQEEQQEEKSE